MHTQWRFPAKLPANTTSYLTRNGSQMYMTYEYRISTKRFSFLSAANTKEILFTNTWDECHFIFIYLFIYLLFVVCVYIYWHFLVWWNITFVLFCFCLFFFTRKAKNMFLKFGINMSLILWVLCYYHLMPPYEKPCMTILINLWCMYIFHLIFLVSCLIKSLVKSFVWDLS